MSCLRCSFAATCSLNLERCIAARLKFHSYRAVLEEGRQLKGLAICSHAQALLPYVSTEQNVLKKKNKSYCIVFWDWHKSNIAYFLSLFVMNHHQTLLYLSRCYLGSDVSVLLLHRMSGSFALTDSGDCPVSRTTQQFASVRNPDSWEDDSGTATGSQKVCGESVISLLIAVIFKKIKIGRQKPHFVFGP